MTPALHDDDVRTQLGALRRQWSSRDDLRDAAVLLPLVERDGVDHIVFTLRRDHLGSHAGQVSFPGGAGEGDEDAATCALREMHEEIGVPSDAVDLLGRLPDRISVAGHHVMPFVGRITPDVEYVVDPNEVAELFEIALPAFADHSHWRFRDLDRPRGDIVRIPYFDDAPHVIWGLTGVILCDFLARAAGFDPRTAG